MSAPVNLDIFNSANFGQLTNNANKANYPVLQGMLVLPNGVTWGDGTYQNSASGTGGGVTNPMISNLDGGGFSITNVDTYSGLFVNVDELNNNGGTGRIDILSPVNHQGNRIQGLPNPIDGTDAANKQYVDSVVFVPANLKWMNTGNTAITAPAASQWYTADNMSVAPINDGYTLTTSSGRVVVPSTGIYRVRFSCNIGSALNGEFTAKAQIIHVASGVITNGVCCESVYMKKFSNTLAQGANIVCEGMVEMLAGDYIYPQIYYTSEPPGVTPRFGANYNGNFNSSLTNDGTELLMQKIG